MKFEITNFVQVKVISIGNYLKAFGRAKYFSKFRELNKNHV